MNNMLHKRVGCFNEYDTLKEVVMCQPMFMKIREVINETQKHFMNEGIHIERAMKQHKQFVKTLEDCGIKVSLLAHYSKFPEQVFTRDIGFTLGKTIFVADMAHDVRKGEEDIFKQWLEDERFSYYNIIGQKIEGGDVVIDQDTIYIGISNRTNHEAIQHLSELLDKQFTVSAIDFQEKFLHLDCIFNVVSPDTALIYSPALKREDINRFRLRYKQLIEVSEQEQFTLGTNVLSIGQNRILSLPVNKEVNKELRRSGFEVIEVDITEIIKSGGSFRCCTLPILRVRERRKE